MIATSLVLGWREALESWRNEVEAAVATTEWDRTDTMTVAIRGPTSVATAAQRLLREVQAELEVEGRRVTPDSYLRFALADKYFVALRAFIEDSPELLADYFEGPGGPRLSPALETMIATQALQALTKADSVAHAIPRVVDDLSALRGDRDPLPTNELGDLSESIRRMRFEALERIASAITRLRPEHSTASPDLFGEAWFTLVHHAERAIANGDVDLVQHIFSEILDSTFILHEHVFSTYKLPTYQMTPGHLDPVMDALELSGLALIYEELRGDDSAAPVREAWATRIEASGQVERSASDILDLLDLASSAFPFQVSPRSAARGEWGLRLANRIIEEGYARPAYEPFRDLPHWDAPPLIKMLGVEQSKPSLFLYPQTIFAAVVLGPLSRESEETLRARPGLRLYFEQRDWESDKFHRLDDATDASGEDEVR